MLVYVLQLVALVILEEMDDINSFLCIVLSFLFLEWICADRAFIFGLGVLLLTLKSP